jgi:hypothetical protein
MVGVGTGREIDHEAMAALMAHGRLSAMLLD